MGRILKGRLLAASILGGSGGGLSPAVTTPTPLPPTPTIPGPTPPTPQPPPPGPVTSLLPPTLTLASTTAYPPELQFVFPLNTVEDDFLDVQFDDNDGFTSPTAISVQLTTANINGTEPVSTQAALAGIVSPQQTHFRAKMRRGAESSAWSPNAFHEGSAQATLAGLLVEGDSITSNSPGVSNGSYAWLYKDAHPSETINIRAQGSRILGAPANLDDGGNSLYGHRTEDLGYNAGTWSVFIGANDLGGTTYASGQAYFDALAAYMAPIRAAGVKVALASILPFDSRHPQAATHNTKRSAFNTILQNNLSQVADYLIPFGSIPEFNTGADPLPVLSDGVHLSPTGIDLTAEVYAAVMDAIRTNATGTAPSGSAWFGANITDAAQGAVIERRYVVKGLAPGSTAQVNVSGTGGRIKVGAGAYGTTPLTVRNGDVVMLEITASGSLSTPRSVDVTMGTSTQTVTVTTAATAPATTTWSTTDKNPNTVIVANSDNRVMTGAPDVGGPMIVRSTTSRDSGKVRAQFIIEAAGENPAVGVMSGTQSVTVYEVAGRNNDNGASYLQDGIFDATGGSAYTFFNLPTVVAGDKIDILVDLDADLMWFLRNGTPLHGDPAEGTGGAVIPTGPMFLQASVNGPSGRVRMNAGQEAFLGNYPAFAAWG